MKERLVMPTYEQNNDFGCAPVFNCVLNRPIICLLNTVITLSFFGNKCNVDLVCLHLNTGFYNLSNIFHNLFCLYVVTRVCIQVLVAI